MLLSRRMNHNVWSRRRHLPYQIDNCMMAIIPPLYSKGLHRCFTNKPTTLLATAKTTIEPLNKLLATVQLFQRGLARLKVDFFNSLHIQEAELTRLHLQRKIRRDYEQRRQRLRMHQKHGVHVVDTAGREVAFVPSNLYTYPTRQKQNNNNSHNHSNQQQSSATSIHPLLSSSAYGNYLSTRRPQEHLRQISRDLRITLPTVAAFMFLPMVGYSFLFLGMIFPRLLLSRQFHTREQRWEFATKEYGERRVWWGRLCGDFWGSCMRSMPGLVALYGEDECSSGEEEEPKNGRCKQQQPGNIPQFLEPLSYLRMDAAGPVFSKQSMLVLYNLFQHIICQSNDDASKSPSIRNLQRTHLHSLALSNNLASPMLLPSSVAPLFLQTCLPTIYLQYKLSTLAEDIIMDDAALIEEGQLDSKCSGMTEEEVLDACWLRGIPVGRFAKTHCQSGSNPGVASEAQIMRKALTHHLQMMKAAMMQHTSSLSSSETKDKGAGLRSKGDLVRDGTLQLLVLHLPAIRYSTDIR